MREMHPHFEILATPFRFFHPRHKGIIVSYLPRIVILHASLTIGFEIFLSKETYKKSSDGISAQFAVCALAYTCPDGSCRLRTAGGIGRCLSVASV